MEAEKESEIDSKREEETKPDSNTLRETKGKKRDREHAHIETSVHQEHARA